MFDRPHRVRETDIEDEHLYLAVASCHVEILTFPIVV